MVVDGRPEGDKLLDYLVRPPSTILSFNERLLFVVADLPPRRLVRLLSDLDRRRECSMQSRETFEGIIFLGKGKPSFAKQSPLTCVRECGQRRRRQFLRSMVLSIYLVSLLSPFPSSSTIEMCADPVALFSFAGSGRPFEVSSPTNENEDEDENERETRR